MLTVSRRGFLVLGGTGASAVALAACGQTTTQRDDSSPEELKTAEADAETALAQAYGAAAAAQAKGEERTTLEQFAKAAGERADGLGGATAQAGDTPPDGGPDSAEALDGAIRAANTAIAAHRQAAGLLDEEAGRALASSYLVACAAELAAVDHFAGSEQSPSPFVTGGDQDPYEAVDDSTTSTTSSSTTTTSSTTSTEGG